MSSFWVGRIQIAGREFLQIGEIIVPSADITAIYVRENYLIIQCKDRAHMQVLAAHVSVDDALTVIYRVLGKP